MTTHYIFRTHFNENVMDLDHLKSKNKMAFHLQKREHDVDSWGYFHCNVVYTMWSCSALNFILAALTSSFNTMTVFKQKCQMMNDNKQESSNTSLCKLDL